MRSAPLLAAAASVPSVMLMPALCRRCTGVTPLPIFAGPVGQCTTLVPVPRSSAMSSGSRRTRARARRPGRACPRAPRTRPGRRRSWRGSSRARARSWRSAGRGPDPPRGPSVTSSRNSSSEHAARRARPEPDANRARSPGTAWRPRAHPRSPPPGASYSPGLSGDSSRYPPPSVMPAGGRRASRWPHRLGQVDERVTAEDQRLEKCRRAGLEHLGAASRVEMRAPRPR